MPPSPAKSHRYTGTAIALHWILGLSLIGLLVFGWYMTGLPFSPTKLKYINWHKWAGISLLLLSALRLLWRLTHRAPALPEQMAAGMPRWQHLAHHGVHYLLYALFFAVPLLGWAYSSAAGFPIVWFGALPLPDLLSPNAELAQALKPWHQIAAYSLAALIAVHIAAALKHQLLDRDGLLQRMLPGRR